MQTNGSLNLCVYLSAIFVAGLCACKWWWWWWGGDTLITLTVLSLQPVYVAEECQFVCGAVQC